MNIEIRKLTNDLVEDYIHFFDITPHDDMIDEHKCYCVCWCNQDYKGQDFSTVEKRRDLAYQYVKNNNIQGYLAYYDDKVVGWCNANAKLDCLHCIGWRIMDYVPIDELENKIKTKSIFCFMIAKEMQRKGIATLLLERVCQDALNEGFDYVEAYPYKANSYHSSDFGGYVKMYEKFGFQIIKETDKGIVMRKKLK